MKKRKGASLIIFALGAITILSFACFVIDLGIVVNAQNEFQKVLDSAALIGASNLEPTTDNTGVTQINTSNAKQATLDTYTSMVSSLGLKNANATPTIDETTHAASKAIKIESDIEVTTFFAKLVGINKIKINAQAAAISAPIYLSSKLPQGLVNGSIIAESQGDTDIRNPVGDSSNVNSNINNILGAPDNKALSLGPGGYIMIKLPSALMDMPGAELYVRELGTLEGYYIFAGNDTDPNNPYTNEAMQGGGISWTNISCTGIPANADNTGKAGAYYKDISYYGTTRTEAKFYGSGYFDLGSKCSADPNGSIPYDGTGATAGAGNIKSAKYLKIIDDNIEDGFLQESSANPVLLIGEHASITPGADIDSVAVLHHPRLISVDDFNTDSDNDGLIDIVEEIIGTNPNVADTDGDGVNDAMEYIGWYNNGGGGKLDIINRGSTQVFMTCPTQSDVTGALPIRL
ncbi:MAG: pilus assembly protein TadG-related protein [bacterium]